MSRSLYKALVLLFWSAQLLCAENSATAVVPPAQVQAVSKPKEVSKDPAISSENPQQEVIAPEIPPNKTLSSVDSSMPSEEIRDPTVMNQNFRDALKRITQQPGVPDVKGSAAAPAVAAAPKISLIACILGANTSMHSALLMVDDKKYTVRIGDIVAPLATLKTQTDLEFQVTDIHKHYVKILMISPINKTLVLR